MTSRRLAAVRADGTLFVIGGAFLAAFSAYLFQLVGGRVLGAEEFAPITVLWTVQFLVFTIVLVPFEQMTVRRLTMDATHRLRSDLSLIGPVIGATAVIVAVALWLTRDSLLDGKALHAVQAGLLVVGYGVFATARGALSGRRRFRDYGLATASESALRLAIAVVVLATAASSVGVVWSMVFSPWVILVARPFRRAEPQTAAVATESATVFLAALIVANAASHTILAAGPLVVGGLGADSEATSTFFVTLILARLPLTLSYGLQSRFLEPMAAMVRDGRSQRLGAWGARIVLAGVLLLIPAWLLGRILVPGLVQLLFGSDFRPSATLGAIVAVGAVAAVACTFTGQVMVARGHTGRLAVAWLIGLGVAAATITVATGAPEIRVALGFLAGELTALAGLWLIAVRGGADGVGPPAKLTAGPVDEII